VSECSKVELVSVFKLQFKTLVITIYLYKILVYYERSYIVTTAVTHIAMLVHKRTGKNNRKKMQVIVRNSAQFTAV
jgi:hypothetical protein